MLRHPILRFNPGPSNTLLPTRNVLILNRVFWSDCVNDLCMSFRLDLHPYPYALACIGLLYALSQHGIPRIKALLLLTPSWSLLRVWTSNLILDQFDFIWFLPFRRYVFVFGCFVFVESTFQLRSLPFVALGIFARLLGWLQMYDAHNLWWRH